jgi:hypothetical protein
MSNYRPLVRFAALLAVACVPVFAQVKTVTPEPSLVILTAVGVGAVVLIARKKRQG